MHGVLYTEIQYPGTSITHYSYIACACVYLTIWLFRSLSSEHIKWNDELAKRHRLQNIVEFTKWKTKFALIHNYINHISQMSLTSKLGIVGVSFISWNPIFISVAAIVSLSFLVDEDVRVCVIEKWNHKFLEQNAQFYELQMLWESISFRRSPFHFNSLIFPRDSCLLTILLPFALSSKYRRKL